MVINGVTVQKKTSVCTGFELQRHYLLHIGHDLKWFCF